MRSIQEGNQRDNLGRGPNTHFQEVPKSVLDKNNTEHSRHLNESLQEDKDGFCFGVLWLLMSLLFHQQAVL